MNANANSKERKLNGMRISFDLDEVLFVSPIQIKAEPPLKYPLNKIFKERLRLGTKKLIDQLKKEGFEVWVYTSSFRSVKYIRRLFRHYGISFDDIVNGERHQNEIQSARKEAMPTKLPSRYHIALHVDDEVSVIRNGKLHGYETYQLFEQDDEWVEKILEKARNVYRKKQLQTQQRLQQ